MLTKTNNVDQPALENPVQQQVFLLAGATRGIIYIHNTANSLKTSRVFIELKFLCMKHSFSLNSDFSFDNFRGTKCRLNFLQSSVQLLTMSLKAFQFNFCLREFISPLPLRLKQLLSCLYLCMFESILIKLCFLDFPFVRTDFLKAEVNTECKLEGLWKTGFHLKKIT